MLSFKEKISYLEDSLDKIGESYADSFRTDILFFFDDFDSENPDLHFLNNIYSLNGIEDWITKLTSRITMKFDEENEQLHDFIYDYVNNR